LSAADTHERLQRVHFPDMAATIRVSCMPTLLPIGKKHGVREIPFGTTCSREAPSAESESESESESKGRP
jgi:hypothetical protein